jgi:hypothetical protein
VIGDGLRTRLGFSDEGLIEGRTTEEQRAELARQVRAARVQAARANSRWSEIPETRLVRRGRLLVDAETDYCYSVRRGVVFEPRRATIAYVSPETALSFFVDQGGEVVFLEQRPGTWSEVVARQAARR